MTGRRWRRERRSERGAAAVEFAFIAPFLIFLVFGIIGVGYMLSFRQALGQAASEGARNAAVAVAALPDTGNGDSKEQRAREAVNSALGSYGVSCTGGRLIRANGADAGSCVISVRVACQGSSTGAECARVALDYTYREDSLLPSVPGLGLVLPEHLRYTAEVEINR